MADWEFLIQKEGDRSWLPLDSPNVEILEGRYRIVSRSNRVNTPVEIRVIHLASQEMPPRRRVQKRSGQTNEMGLVAVIPFTQLQAGIWELQCASLDLMSDLLGNSWQHAVRLQVQPKQMEEDWESDWQIDTVESKEVDQTSEPELTPGLPSLHQAYPSWLKVVADPDALQTAVDRLLEMSEVGNGADLISSDADTDQPLVSAALSDVVEIETQLDATEIGHSETVIEASTHMVTCPAWLCDTTRSLTLRLEQPGIVVSPGQVVMVAGWVEIQVAEADQTPSQRESGLADQAVESKVVIPQEIQLWLRDPQTLEVISSDRQPFPELVPPFLFTFSFTLPTRLTTHLLLGEVLLYGQLPDSQRDRIAIDTQTFSITVNPVEWMSLLAPEEAESAAIEQPMNDELAEAEEPVTPVQLPSLEPPSPTPTDTPLDLELSFLLTPEEVEKRSGKLYKILPPQIYHPEAEEAASRSLELPKFVIAKPPEPAPTPTADDGESAEAGAATVSDGTSPADEEAALQPIDFSPSDDMVTNQAQPSATIEITDEPSETSTDLHTAVADQVNEDVAAVNVELPAAAELPVADQPTALERESQPVPTSSQVADLPEPALQAQDEVDDSLAGEGDSHAVPALEETEDPYLVAANQAFKALKLHDRFLSRLSSLATDMELAAWLKAGEQPQQVEQVLEMPMPVAPPPDFWADEIVVDDQPDAAPRRAGRTPPSQNLKVDAIDETEPTPLPVQPLDRSIPVPELNLVSGELVSGELVQLRVRLPEADVGFYAKVWITDCETRQLLDGPHWLVDFLPNGFGGQDAFVQLTVPFGSTAVQFEAIAFEIHSQCESRKAIAMRPVVPPDLPIVTFDEFSDRL